MIFALLTLIVGLSISTVAGYFSIIGLGQLFAASFWGVVLMGVVIESGKIISAAWLHRNWKNPLVSKFHKAYLCVAIVVAMSITALGIFSYLSKAHLDQEQPVIQQLTEEATLEKQLQGLQSDLDTLQADLQQINQISNNSNNSHLDYQRYRIITEMDKDRQQIQAINKRLAELEKETSKFELQLGPAKYLGDIIFGAGSQNADKAVEIFIVLIMTVFDPLAIMLVLSSNISFQELAQKKETKKVENNQKIKENLQENQEVKNENNKNPTDKPNKRNWISG